MGEEPEIMGCSSPLSWVLLAKEKKREEKKRRKKKEERRGREKRGKEGSRKLRLGNYNNFKKKKEEKERKLISPSLFCCFCCFELGLKLALIDWLWSSIEEFLSKENVGVLGEMLSNFFQNPCFCFSHNLTISHPN